MADSLPNYKDVLLKENARLEKKLAKALKKLKIYEKYLKTEQGNINMLIYRPEYYHNENN